MQFISASHFSCRKCKNWRFCLWPDTIKETFRATSSKSTFYAVNYVTNHQKIYVSVRDVLKYVNIFSLTFKVEMSEQSRANRADCEAHGKAGQISLEADPLWANGESLWVSGLFDFKGNIRSFGRTAFLQPDQQRVLSAALDISLISFL